MSRKRSDPAKAAEEIGKQISRGVELTHSFPIVGVGASAGGIEAYTALLKALPADPGMGFVFVLHQDPKYSSNLDQILARATPMPVEIARAGMVVRPDHVYVAPADAEVSIEHGVMQLHDREKS